MRLPTTLALATLLSPVFLPTSLHPPSPRPQEDGLEPEVELVLELDGYPIPVLVDEPFVVSVGEACATGVLRRRDRRRFELASLAFSYPSYMVFRAELSDPAARRWTLTGNGVELALTHHVDPRSSTRALLEAEVERLRGAEETEVRWEHLDLAGRRASGRSLRTWHGGVGVQRRVFALSHGEDVFVLVLAENLDGRGRPMPEGVQALKLLQETLQLR